MADKHPQFVTGPKVVDPFPTIRHLRKEHANSIINATNAKQSTPSRAASSRVKNVLVHNHPSKLPHRPPQPTTPVSVDRLEVPINDYAFPLKRYLIQVLIFEGETCVSEPPNLTSAIGRQEIVRDKLTYLLNPVRACSHIRPCPR